MSVRTAASASSREGRGTTGSGAARTCSERVDFSVDGFGQGLMTASIARSLRSTGLVGRGCHRGGRISHTRFGRFDPCAATGRRIPNLHGFLSNLLQLASPARRPPPAAPLCLLAPPEHSLYIA